MVSAATSRKLKIKKDIIAFVKCLTSLMGAFGVLLLTSLPVVSYRILIDHKIGFEDKCESGPF